MKQFKENCILCFQAAVEMYTETKRQRNTGYVKWEVFIQYWFYEIEHFYIVVVLRNRTLIRNTGIA